MRYRFALKPLRGCTYNERSETDLGRLIRNEALNYMEGEYVFSACMSKLNYQIDIEFRFLFVSGTRETILPKLVTSKNN